MTPHTTVTRIEPGQVIVTDRFMAGTRHSRRRCRIGRLRAACTRTVLRFEGTGRTPVPRWNCVAPRRIEQAIAEGRQIGEQC